MTEFQHAVGQAADDDALGNASGLSRRPIKIDALTQAGVFCIEFAVD
jgi:hypothetical protein